MIESLLIRVDTIDGHRRVGECLEAGFPRSLGDTRIVQKALRRLVQLELVEAAGRGRYRVRDAFFRNWLSQSD
jgi:hypothetical protein